LQKNGEQLMSADDKSDYEKNLKITIDILTDIFGSDQEIINSAVDFLEQERDRDQKEQEKEYPINTSTPFSKKTKKRQTSLAEFTDKRNRRRLNG
jgi:hypothetical protein